MAESSVLQRAPHGACIPPFPFGSRYHARGRPADGDLLVAQNTELYEAVLSGDKNSAVELTRAALDASVDPQSLIDDAMIPAMDEVGRLFEEEEYFVPELLLAARAMKSALELIRPLLAETGAPSKGRIVIGTVQGDLHDIGKNLVSAMFEGAGFDVIDLGSDVPAEQFVAAAKEKDADLVGLSALLTVTMQSMKSVVDGLEAAGLRDRVKVLVGGAPLSTSYADEIKADAYADNATAAVRAAFQLLGV
ncbi:MAG: cobalamin-binding protein [bacterium]|nr:cobalamin-binding protein [bacterium]